MEVLMWLLGIGVIIGLVSICIDIGFWLMERKI